MPQGNDPPPDGRSRRRAAAPHGELRGRLRPHDPFELIRWLAHSQPDPRKALAELVQNSLDAGAIAIRVTRRRERGAPCLFVWDDGHGVIPELERTEALKFIATHIGHSRKRSLSPEERFELMTQGQYGIGLLGFWCLGQMLEMRTSVPGQRPHRLILYRDRPSFRIEPLKGRLSLDERWTEIVVTGLHPQAQAVLVGRRAADYLGSELRGQLLQRTVDLVIEDRMSRGRAQKLIPVRPVQFLGEQVEGIGPLAVPGYPPIRFEIYLVGERGEDVEGGAIALYSAGTLVASDFHELTGLGLDRPPWTDRRLSGLVDFPAFRLAPGSRRGIVMDAAATAFSVALRSVEPVLESLLESVERRRAEELDRTMIRDLQRAFRDFYRHRPSYSMLPVRSEPDRTPAAAGGDGEGAAGSGLEASTGVAATGPARPAHPRADLLPPGPLHGVRITPSPLRIECRGARRARAEAFDAAGRPVQGDVSHEWSLSASIATLSTEGEALGRVAVLAGEREGTASLDVTARQDGREARAEVEVAIVAEIPAGQGSEGVPEPELVHRPAEAWRSRFEDGRWQVNSGHREYRAIADRPALKLRYLAMLFAKEVVLRSHRDPRLESPLEQLVEIACYADRRIATKGRRPKEAREGPDR